MPTAASMAAKMMPMRMPSATSAKMFTPSPPPATSERAEILLPPNATTLAVLHRLSVKSLRERMRELGIIVANLFGGQQ